MNIKASHSTVFDVLTVVVDILLVLAVVYGAGLLVGVTIDWPTALIFLACVIFLLHIYEFYSKSFRRLFEVMLSLCITCFLSDFMTFIVRIVVLRYTALGPLFYAVLFAGSFAVLLLWKLLHMRIVKRIEGAPTLLVIESDAVENDLARKVKYSYGAVFRAWYLMIDVQSEDAIREIIDTEIDRYNSIFISPSIPETLKYRFVSAAFAKGKEVFILPDMYSIGTLKSEMVQFDDTPALRVKQFALSKFDRYLKRAFDILVSAVGVIASSPIMLVCAVLVKLDSPGPIIYSQERLTIHQKPFTIYKFRTMVKDAEKLTGATLATDNDPRITRVGKVLRSTRLDELPQLFNVLFGHMSIVGPRPERRIFVDEYLHEIPDFDKRFLVKAGLTGLTQVYAKYNSAVTDRTLYDLLYIREYSFGLDIKLILLTVKIMFVKESAEGVKEATVYTKTGEAVPPVDMKQ